MGSFVEDLWSSVFTPGPTPTLLVATNVTFAALQAVLLALLIATYSVHFLVLSFLSGALWWSINWFAQELKQVQEQEAQEAQKAKEGKKTHADGKPRKRTPGGLDNSDSDTETEIASEQRKATPVASAPVSAARAATAAAATAASSASLQLPEEEGSRKRHSVSGESSGYGSTDSEWEKVDDSHIAS